MRAPMRLLVTLSAFAFFLLRFAIAHAAEDGASSSNDAQLVVGLRPALVHPIGKIGDRELHRRAGVGGGLDLDVSLFVKQFHIGLTGGFAVFSRPSPTDSKFSSTSYDVNMWRVGIFADTMPAGDSGFGPFFRLGGGYRMAVVYGTVDGRSPTGGGPTHSEWSNLYDGLELFSEGGLSFTLPHVRCQLGAQISVARLWQRDDENVGSFGDGLSIYPSLGARGTFDVASLR